MKTVVLLTYHVWNSKRKAGFHHIANELISQNWRVLFLTTGLSLFSTLIKDFRLNNQSIKGLNKLIRINDLLYTYIHYTLWHSVGFKIKILDQLLKPLAKNYKNFSFQPAESIIRSADLIIFESTDGILLFERIKALNQNAKLIYRMSDPLGSLRKNPWHLDYEQKIISCFSLVSTPSHYHQYKHYSNTKVHFHGVDIESFDKCLVSPYKTKKKCNLYRK